MANNFKNNFLIFSVYNNDKIVSGCLILIYRDHAFYFLAASNEYGRKTFASYYMIKELFEYLGKQGIGKFDFGGITPYNPEAQGVNKFKMGFGGDIIQYIGEWEISNSKALSFFVNNIFLKLKTF